MKRGVGADLHKYRPDKTISREGWRERERTREMWTYSSLKTGIRDPTEYVLYKSVDKVKTAHVEAVGKSSHPNLNSSYSKS
jgi:hypothetical protein